MRLFEARAKRPRPHLDDKILTAWNGLMISAFAKGGAILDEPKYVEAARGAADFILATLRREDGTLLRRFRDGDAAIDGMLDDYTFFVQGLLDLYEATSSSAIWPTPSPLRRNKSNFLKTKRAASSLRRMKTPRA